jgi:hypothetical protein
MISSAMGFPLCRSNQLVPLLGATGCKIYRNGVGADYFKSLSLSGF